MLLIDTVHMNFGVTQNRLKLGQICAFLGEKQLTTTAKRELRQNACLWCRSLCGGTALKSGQHKELGSRTDRRPSLKEQTPPLPTVQACTREEVGNKECLRCQYSHWMRQTSRMGKTLRGNLKMLKRVRETKAVLASKMLFSSICNNKYLFILSQNLPTTQAI